eukprot:m.40930 g.40930  ORF g.40930 m.40930 type:complete len:162 (+) comp6047_c0_seq2:229-714(+)
MSAAGASAGDKKGRMQTLEDAYAEPTNFLEIEVVDPVNHGFGKKRYTDYTVIVNTNLPIFRQKNSTVRRRYSDFDWLRSELERTSKILVPPLPGKALARQMPWVAEKDGMFAEDFIEERRSKLEEFINKVAGHPLAQKEKCLHMFLQAEHIDRDYVPGKLK